MKYMVLFIVCIGIGIGVATQYPIKPISTSPSITPTSMPTFSIQDAPSDSLKGIMKHVSGEVFWQTRTATEPALLTTVVPVQQGELIKTGKNGSIVIMFPEACSIEMRADSMVDVIQTLPGHIVLRQDQGMVLYNATSDCPLSVRTRRMLTVISEGTTAVDLDPNSDIISIQVRKGTAQVAYNDAINVSTLVPLQEGEQFQFDNQERNGEIVDN